MLGVFCSICPKKKKIRVGPSVQKARVTGKASSSICAREQIFNCSL